MKEQNVKKPFWAFLTDPEYWKKAGSEVLEFAIIAPMIVMLIYSIVAATQIAHINQALNYCAYNTCRSAVVSTDMVTAKQRANQTYELQFGMDNANAYGYTACSLEILGNAQWEKGSFLKCTVRYYVETIDPFSSGIHEQTIIMMIENGA